MSRQTKPLQNAGGPGGPGGQGRHGFQKPKNPMRTLLRLFHYFSGNIPLLIFALVLTVVSAAAGVVGAALLKPVVNGLTENLARLINGSDLSTSAVNAAKEAILGDLSGLLVLMGSIYLAGAAASYLSSRIMVSLAQRTTNRLRGDLFEHMQDLPIGYFDSHAHGELMSRYTNDIESVIMALEQSLSQTVSSLITVVATFVLMVVYSPILTVFVLLMLLVMMKVIKAVGSRSAGYFRAQQKALGHLDGYIEEIMEGQKVVKVFNHETAVCEDFYKKNNALKEAAVNAQTFAGILMPIMGNLSYVHYAVTATFGAIMIVNPWNWGIFAGMTIGTLASYLQFTRNFSQPITQISNQSNMLLAALAGAERIFDVLDQEAEQDTGKTTLVLAESKPDGTLQEIPGDPFSCFSAVWQGKTDSVLAWKTPCAAEPSVREGAASSGYRLTALHGDVRFHDVVFSYIPGRVVLNRISLYAKPNQKIAFVGSTGAGKTTITNLINRFYEIQEGRITYDGIDIRDIRKADLRRTMGIVLQDVHLFKGTIKENIRYGKLDATEEEIIRAAKIANAHSFIKRLPDGYDTMLAADGINLSQGQRQLLSIARAAVADPPVIILDEATSSIDTRTERLIEKGMDSLMQGRTTFVIAHRLSTVRNSNAIMVLEHGEIIERGDHDDLLSQKGRYYRLYTGSAELS